MAKSYQKVPVLFLLFFLIIGLQFAYDSQKLSAASLTGVIPPTMIRMVDMGFHSTVASFLWVSTMPEILDLFRQRTEYLSDVAYVNAVDPKLSYPYAFSVLTLPAVPKKAFPEGVRVATEMGQRGLAYADPDWRIPFYLATNYYLELKDKKSAQLYYDVAARTPGAPSFAVRFSLNFGVGANERERTKQLWETIRDTTNDEFTKERAQAYVDRLAIFDYLESVAKVYKQKFGVYPTMIDDLVTKKIIPKLPQDPFGFTFILNSDGTAGIDVLKPPPGFAQ